MNRARACATRLTVMFGKIATRPRTARAGRDFARTSVLRALQVRKRINQRTGATVVALALVYAIALLSQPGAVLRAQSSSGWSRPEQVANPLHKSWFPALTADANGVVHLAYASNALETRARLPYDMVEYIAFKNGQLASTRLDIMSVDKTGEGSEAARPSLATGRDGVLHLTWRDADGIYYTRAEIERATLPVAWRAPVLIGEGYFSQILEDERGVLHVLYTNNVITAECQICYHLYYSRSTDGGVTWSAGRDVSVLATGAAKPKAVLDDEGRVHVAWEIGRGGSQGQTMGQKTVGYARMERDGLNWSEPQVFTPPEPGAQASQPALARDGGGRLIMIWLSNSDDFFYAQVSQDNGQRWSAPQRIAGIYNNIGLFDSRLDTIASVTDSAGQVHVILVGRTDLSKSVVGVFHLIWDGVRWSEPEALTLNDYNPRGDAPQWPAVAISNGNRLNAVWYLRRGEYALAKGDEPPPYEIYYTSSLLASPEIGAVPYPARALASAATLAPAVIATPAPPLDISREIPPVTMQSLTNEFAVWRIIGLSILPVCVAAAVIVLVRKRGR
jgi:hypothetical protein